jgi:hypothetical protein
MRLEYGKIFKQAWQITKTNKFLWLFGLFLFWANAFSFNYGYPDVKDPQSTDMYRDQLTNWIQAHLQLAVILSIAVVLVFIVLLYLYFRSRVAILIAIKALLDKQETSFHKSFKAGKLFLGRTFGVVFVANLIMVVLTAIISGPIMYLYHLGLDGRANVLYIFGMCILVPVSFVIFLVNALGPIFVVFYDQKIGEAIRSSIQLVTKHWVNLLVFTIYASVIVLSALIVVGLLLAPFVLLGFFAYHKMDETWNLIWMSISIGIGFIIFLSINAVVAVFQQTSWVLVFLELIKPEKMSETESLPATEVAS